MSNRLHALPRVGAVVAHGASPWWVVKFPHKVHEPARVWLCDLAASDVSRATLRSYGYDLLRWLRFLDAVGLDWQRAERSQVREFVEFLREAPNPLRAGRSAALPALGSVNPLTGKPYPGTGYAARTINHQLTVLHGFYEFVIDSGDGPLVNPVRFNGPAAAVA